MASRPLPGWTRAPLAGPCEVPGDAAGPPSLCQSLHTWSPSQGVRRQSRAGRLGRRSAASGRRKGRRTLRPDACGSQSAEPVAVVDTE